MGGGPGFAPNAGTSKSAHHCQGVGTPTVLEAVDGLQVPYGHEQQEKLAVRAIPRYAGRPTGTVTMLWRGVTLCDREAQPGRRRLRARLEAA